MYTSTSPSQRRQRPPPASQLAASSSTCRPPQRYGLQRGRIGDVKGGNTYCENTDKETNAEVDDHTVLREWTKWRQGYTDEDVPQPWGAHEEFLRALPQNNANVDEVMAVADRFLILLENSPEATWCCAKVLGDIDTIIERKEEGRGKMGVASTQLTDTGSVGRLHYALLRMIKRCLPRLTTASCGGIVDGVQPQHSSSDNVHMTSYSVRSVESALRLARRAEELGLPPHRPLY